MKNPKPVSGTMDCSVHEAATSDVVSLGDLGDLGESFDEGCRRVETGGERMEIRKDGRTIAALVPLSDLKALEALEDRLDALDALDALADYRANGGASFEKVMSELGL